MVRHLAENVGTVPIRLASDVAVAIAIRGRSPNVRILRLVARAA